MELGQCPRFFKTSRIKNFDRTDCLQAREALLTSMRALQKGSACLSDHL